MAWNGFNVGHDATIDITDPTTGAIMKTPKVTGFSAEPNYKQISSEPLNDAPIFFEIPTGWHGTIDFDRTDNTLDSFVARLEALYFSGVNTLNGTATQTINEQGSVSQYQYPAIALKLTQAGQWKAQDKVSMQISWTCGRRLQIV